MDFIPLVTDDYRLAFCTATKTLPSEIQQIIYKKALCTPSPPPPGAPKKKVILPSPRLAKLMEGWKGRN